MDPNRTWNGNSLPEIDGSDEDFVMSFMGGAPGVTPAWPTTPGAANVSIATGSSRQIVGSVNTTFTGPIQNVTNNYTSSSWPRPSGDDLQRQEHRQILEWLSPQPQNHRNTLKSETSKRVDGTGTWFFESETYRQWLSGSLPLLWLIGGDDPSLEELREALVESLKANCTKTKSVKSEVLQDVFILIDALDEVPNDQIELVATLLQDLGQLELPKLRILCTSRYQPDIDLALSQPVRWQKQDMNQSSIVQDVEKYVLDALSSSKLRLLDQQLKNDIVERAARQGEGMFRLAALKIGMLKDLPLRGQDDVRLALSTLPTTLNETYEQILGKIPSNIQEITLSALKWIIAARRPLFVEEVVDAAYILTNSPLSEKQHNNRCPASDLIQVLRGLVTVQPRIQNFENIPSKQHTMMISHNSVQEFLTGVEIRNTTTKSFGFNIEAANDTVGLGCIVYLYHYNRHHVEPNEDTHPLSRYAWFNWERHLKNYEDEDRHAMPRVYAVRLLKLLKMHVESSRIAPTTERLATTTVTERSTNRSNFDNWISWIPIEGCSILYEALNTAFFTQSYWEYVHEKSLSRAEIYSASSLSSCPRMIRLLSILPHLDPEDPSNWRVLCCPIEQAPVYTAISYTWWAPNTWETPIFSASRCLLDFDIGVSPSAGFILSTLPYVTFHAAETPSAFWIDQISINQYDEEERAHQIPLMPDIYHGASATVCQLRGKPEEGDQYGVEHFYRLANLASTGSTTEAAQMLVELHQDNKLQRLLDLFNAKWWTRIWMVQEAVISPDLRLMYGTLSIPIGIAEQVFDVIDDLYSNLDEDANHGKLTRRRLQETAGWDVAINISKTRKEYHHGSKTPLSQLIYRFCKLQAVNPCDLLYALDSISQRDCKMRVRYDQTTCQLYMETTFNMLMQMKTLDAVAFASVTENGDMPSWVPDFGYRITEMIPLSAGGFKGVDYVGNFATEALRRNLKFEVVGAPRINNTILEVSGVILTSVNTIFPPLELTDPGGRDWRDAFGAIETQLTGVDWHSRIMQQEPLHTAECFSDRLKVPPGETATEVLWRTLSANQWPDGVKLWVDMYQGRTIPPVTPKLSKWLVFVCNGISDKLVFNTGRCLFLTAEGYLGLGPRAMSSGDSIVMLSGGTLPFVLRNREDTEDPTWTVVGECYVHGLGGDESWAAEMGSRVESFSLA
ncbi:hypothetical protein CcaCcLH18_12402 [Colletotrichum camelliae]|nr:hypothetical protein CcaCcLH18_12402 [Colletotrichum camelliae]